MHMWESVLWWNFLGRGEERGKGLCPGSAAPAARSTPCLGRGQTVATFQRGLPSLGVFPWREKERHRTQGLQLEGFILSSERLFSYLAPGGMGRLWRGGGGHALLLRNKGRPHSTKKHLGRCVLGSQLLLFLHVATDSLVKCFPK